MLRRYSKKGGHHSPSMGTKIFAMVVMLAVLLPWISSTASGEAPSEGRKPIRVGYYENEIFEEGAREGAVKTGYAYEYYRKLSEYTGWEYEYVYGSYGDLYQMLLDGEIDLLAGLAFKEERVGLLSYPDEPMGHESYNLIKHITAVDVSADPASFNGKTFGVLDSAMVDVLKKYLTEHHVEAEIVTFDDYSEVFSAFDENTVDIVATEGSGTYGRENAEVVCPFGSSDYYLCVNIKRPDILSEVNSAQSLLNTEEPSYLNTLNSKYYPFSVSSRAFSAAEKNWMDTHESLRVGYLKHYMPYSDMDAQGEVTGLVRDFLPQIFESLDITDIRIDYAGYESYEDMLAAIGKGEVDILFPVGGGLYYSEESGIYQSNPVVSASTELVFTGEYTEEKTRHFAVNDNNRMQYYYVKTHFPEAEITYYPSIDQCLEAVVSGKAGSTTLNGLRANAILKNSKYHGLSMHQLSQHDDRSFGVKIGNEGLLKLINRGITVLGSDHAQNLAHRYTDELYSYTFSDFVKEHTLLLGGLILAVAGIIIGFLIHAANQSRAQMREKENARRTLEEKNQELERSKEALTETDEIIANAGYGIWHILLADGKKPRMRGNNKMMELLGIPGKNISEEELYAFWHERIPEEELPSVDKNVEEMLAGSLSENTYRWNHPENGTIYVRCGGTCLNIGEKEHLLRGYHRDVTEIVREDFEQKEALAAALMAAENANRAKTTFLNNMSHDIRTPMNAIVGFTTLASSRLDDRELVQDYLGKISVSSQHLLSLINDVLDMSRIESGKVTIEETYVHLPDVVHDIRTIVQANMDSKQQELFVDTRGLVHEDIVTDKLRLNQILLNILSNAVKFTPSGGTIRFQVAERPSDQEEIANMEFKIRDNGIGMSKEFQKKIFEAFTREKTSTVSGIQGTGLGMSITKNIVDMMGGTITVESEEGKGTEFTVVIPCRITSRQEEQESGDQSKRNFKGKRILLAEDNEMNQMIAVAILEEFGFDVEIAGNGEQAVEKMKESPAGHFDVILMDIQMPIMDGYEAARQIRRIPDDGKSRIPILAVTANAFEEDRKLAIESGMNGHLAKPYDIPVMMETLAEILS